MKKNTPTLILIIVLSLLAQFTFAQNVTVTKTYNQGSRVHNFDISPAFTCIDGKGNKFELVPVITQQTGNVRIKGFGLIGNSLPAVTKAGGEMNLFINDEGSAAIIHLTAVRAAGEGNWVFDNTEAYYEGFDSLMYIELIDYNTMQVTGLNVPAALRSYVKQAYKAAAKDVKPSYYFTQTKGTDGKPILSANKPLNITAMGKQYTITPEISLENVLPQVVGITINYQGLFTNCITPGVFIKLDDGTVMNFGYGTAASCSSRAIRFSEQQIKKLNTTFIKAITLYAPADAINYTAELNDTSGGYLVELYNTAVNALPTAYVNKKVNSKGNTSFSASRSLMAAIDTANSIELVPDLGNKDNKPYIKQVNLLFKLRSGSCASTPKMIIQLTDSKVIFVDLFSANDCSGLLTLKFQPEDIALLEQKKILSITIDEPDGKTKFRIKQSEQTYFNDLLESIRKM